MHKKSTQIKSMKRRDFLYLGSISMLSMFISDSLQAEPFESSLDTYSLQESKIADIVESIYIIDPKSSYHKIIQIGKNTAKIPIEWDVPEKYKTQYLAIFSKITQGKFEEAIKMAEDALLSSDPSDHFRAKEGFNFILSNLNSILLNMEQSQIYLEKLLRLILLNNDLPFLFGTFTDVFDILLRLKFKYSANLIGEKVIKTPIYTNGMNKNYPEFEYFQFGVYRYNFYKNILWPNEGSKNYPQKIKYIPYISHMTGKFRSLAKKAVEPEFARLLDAKDDKNKPINMYEIKKIALFMEDVAGISKISKTIITYMNDILPAIEKVLSQENRNHLMLGIIYIDFARLLMISKEYKRSIALANKAKVIFLSNFTTVNKYVLNAYKIIMFGGVQAQQYDIVLQNAEELERLLSGSKKEMSEEYIDVLINMADVYLTKKEYEKALSLINKALKIAMKKYGPWSKKVIILKRTKDYILTEKKSSSMFED